MSNRKYQLISSTISSLLIKQLAHELKNYNLYKSYSNYYDAHGILDLATYYQKRADEEHNHHQWIFTYLSDADVTFTYPAIEVNKEVFADYEAPFIQTIDREIETTNLLYNIYEKCIEERDFMTASWLYDKLIKEQIEEENISRMAANIIQEDCPIFIIAERILKLLD